MYLNILTYIHIYILKYSIYVILSNIMQNYIIVFNSTYDKRPLYPRIMFRDDTPLLLELPGNFD